MFFQVLKHWFSVAGFPLGEIVHTLIFMLTVVSPQFCTRMHVKYWIFMLYIFLPEEFLTTAFIASVSFPNTLTIRVVLYY